MGKVCTWVAVSSIFLSLGCTKNNRIYAFSEASIYTLQDLQQTAYLTDLYLVKFADHSWTDEQVKTHVREAAQVYLQCGLRFATVTVSESPLNSTGLSRWDGRSERGYLTVGQAAATNQPKPLVLLMNSFSDDEGNPFAIARYKIDLGESPPQALLNTIFFPSYINTDDYKKDRSASPYSTLAHELLHIFTLDGQHNNDDQPNLLTIWRRRTDRLTDEQCQEVQMSALVRKAVLF